jgi:hypothetical protein
MNGSKTRTTRGFFMPALQLTLAALVTAALLLGLVAPVGADPGNDNRAPDLGICQDLKVPDGNKVAFHVYAQGVQIYRWDGSAWVFVAPEATLFANAGFDGVVGIHYGGPTWESVNGGLVVGRNPKPCTPDPTAIAWLLIEAAPDGPGIFHRVSYIQRVNTVGGRAPSVGGSTIGELARVPYTTEYYFYRSHP